MSAHTPGPWEAIGSLVRGKMPRGALLAQCRDGFGLTNSDESNANARLMAAAPDLLEALLAIKKAGPNGANDFEGWHQAYEPAIEQARAAIAKATGARP